MKKLILSLIISSLTIFCVQPAFAASDTHVIRAWNTDVIYREDNVAQVTESITVDFLKPSHGFFRSIPYIISIEKEINGKLEEMKYRARINNINIEGAPFETSNENGFKILKIGDEDKTVSGLFNYRITYTLDMGDDRISEYDEIFFSLLGADNAATVENFSFSVSFEKPLPNMADLKIYTGKYGSTNEGGVEFEATESEIFGYSQNKIDTGEAVTMYTRLPEGYFENETAITATVPYIILCIAVFALLLILISRARQMREKPVATVEFTAPDGISSAEIGFIIDCISEDKDILSLIIWFADKGYIQINGEENDMTLTKLKSLPENMPAYMQTFFNALFSDNDECLFSESGTDLYSALQSAKAQLPNEFVKERKLYSTSGTALSFITPFIGAGLYIIGALIVTDYIYFSGIFSAVMGAVMIAISGVVGAFSSTQWTFASMGKRAALIIGMLAPIAVGGGLSIFTAAVSVTGFPFYTSVLFAACAALSLIGSQIAKPSSYNVDITGRLLGLKNFIETAELERIKMLAEENPQYFYNVLPYAYVFGLTDVWVKQFENIPLPPPTWYGGAWGMSYYNMYWLTRGINNSHSHMATEFATEQAKSGGNGGSSFGGGGGFSGGGFGGGGSGSW